MQNTQYHFGVSVEEMDPVSRKVYDELIEGKSKKEIANRYKVPMTVVNCISKRFRTGQKDQKIIPAIQVYESKNVTADDIKEEEKEGIKPNTDSIIVSTKKKRMSKEEIEAVINLIAENPDSSLQEIADASGTTYASIASINRRHKDRILSLRSAKSDAKEIVVQENNDNLEPINISESLRVGLVAERHDMPVDSFIFDKPISKKIMFDYDRLERLCKEFIEDNIDFDKDGNSKQTLIVYVTGIQCALSSLIKVANKMKVNLVLRHYNSDTDSYFRHVIWNEFGSKNIPDEIEELLVNSKHSYTYNCTVDELLKNKNLFKVSKVLYKSDKSIDHIDTILVKCIDDAFNIMKRKMKESEKLKENSIIFAKEYKMSNDRFYESGVEIKLQSKN